MVKGCEHCGGLGGHKDDCPDNKVLKIVDMPCGQKDVARQMKAHVKACKDCQLVLMERKLIRYRTNIIKSMGYVHANACRLLDADKDPRDADMNQLLAEAIGDLGMDPEDFSKPIKEVMDAEAEKMQD